VGRAAQGALSSKTAVQGKGHLQLAWPGGRKFAIDSPHPSTGEERAMLTDSARFVSDLVTASTPTMSGPVPGEPPTLAMAAIGIVTVCIYLAAGGLRRSRPAVRIAKPQAAGITGTGRQPTREAA
jgi:hypothetical protein